MQLSEPGIYLVRGPFYLWCFVARRYCFVTDVLRFEHRAIAKASLAGFLARMYGFMAS